MQPYSDLELLILLLPLSPESWDYRLVTSSLAFQLVTVKGDLKNRQTKVGHVAQLAECLLA